MTKNVDDVFMKDIYREDSLDTMIESGYGELIDIIQENTEPSIFDTEEGVV